MIDAVMDSVFDSIDAGLHRHSGVGLFLIAALLFAGSGTVQGQSTPPIRAQSASLQQAGSTFWVPVEVGSQQVPVSDLFGVGFTMTYDTSRVTVLDDEAGTVLGSDALYSSNVDTTEGEVGVGVTRKSGDGGVDGSGVVARVKVRVEPDVPEGDTLEFRLSDVKANDPDGNTIPLDPRPRGVTVGAAIPTQPAVQVVAEESDGRLEPGDTIAVDVDVGTSAMPVSDLFGTSVTLTYEPGRVSVLSDQAEPFLGSDLLYSSNLDTTNGEIDIGVSRKAGAGGVDGAGRVARVRARIDPDLGVGTSLTFGVEEPRARNPADSSIALNASAAVITVGRMPSVSVDPPSEAPEAGSSPSITAQIPSEFAPTTGTLFSRETGTASFEEANFSVSEGASEVSVQVPPSAVTERGVEYALRLSEPLAGGDTLRATFPSERPFENPAHLQVQVPAVRASGPYRAGTYRMVSVPLQVGDRSVFDVLEAQYGDYDPSEWRLFRWSPQDSTYREGADVSSALVPGRAAWLITEGSDSLSVQDGQSVPAGGPQELSLAPGWNQVGSPFAFPVAWGEVANSEIVRAPVAYDGTRPEGERYQFERSVLRPWRGSFVFNPQDTTVTLTVPPTEAEESASSTEKARALATAAMEAPSAVGVQAIATMQVGEQRYRDRQTWMGLAEGAAPGVGAEDWPKPPSVGPHVRVDIRSGEGPRLARSLKPISSEAEAQSQGRGAAWDLGVSAWTGGSFQTEQAVTLHLTEEGSRPEGVGRWVLDLDRGTRLPATHGTVEVRVTEGEERRLRVIVGTKAFAEAASEGIGLEVAETKLGANAPNPFSETTRISYQLAEAAEVRLEVYDVLGRKVATLAQGKREAGVHRVTLRVQDLASGVYFCRMEAGAYTGTRKLTVVR